MQEFEMNNPDFLIALMNTMPNPYYFKDTKGIIRLCNNAMAQYMGLTIGEIIGKDLSGLLCEESVIDHVAMDKHLMENGDTLTYTRKTEYKNGITKDIIVKKALVKDGQGHIIGIVGTIHDISDDKKAENRVERLMKVKEAMLRVNHAMIGMENINDILELIMNEAFSCIENADMACILTVEDEAPNVEQLYGEQILRIATCIGYDKEAAKDFKIYMKDSFLWILADGKLDKTLIINDIPNYFKQLADNILDGDTGSIVKSSISAPIIADGKLYGMLNIDSCSDRVFDETDLEIMEYMRNQIAMAVSKYNLYEQTVYLSRYDKLTGLFNRGYFEELAEYCVSKAQRYSEKFSLLIIDLDGLKKINDRYGHLAGDEYIRSFSKSLKSGARSSDVLSRFGGDEFVGIFHEISEENLAARMEALTAELQIHKMQYEGNEIPIGFSYGIASFPEEGSELKELIRLSDSRMYEKKRRKKNPS